MKTSHNQSTVPNARNSRFVILTVVVGIAVGALIFFEKVIVAYAAVVFSGC